jgi:hypothetical protein
MPIASSKGGDDFAPIPAGSTFAICYGVIDIGTPPKHGNFPSRRTILLLFELPHIRADFMVDGQPKNLARVISEKYTLSLSKKANLRKVLVGWRGREFTAAEESKFEVGNVAGAMALLSIVHKKSADGTKTYANIAAIMKPMAGTEKMAPENPKIVFDIPAAGPITFPQNMPEWIVNRIKSSDEYIERSNPNRARNEGPNNGQAFPTDGVNLDEDVPF